MIEHPLGWTLEQRLEHCYKVMDRTMDKYPAIADVWYKAAKILEMQIAQRDQSREANTTPDLPGC